MYRQAKARSNVLTFHTAHWYARERAKARLKQLHNEARAIREWLEPMEECQPHPASPSPGVPRGSSKRPFPLRLCN
jgi:hypothetical protein